MPASHCCPFQYTLPIAKCPSFIVNTFPNDHEYIMYWRKNLIIGTVNCMWANLIPYNKIQNNVEFFFCSTGNCGFPLGVRGKNRNWYLMQLVMKYDFDLLLSTIYCCCFCPKARPQDGHLIVPNIMTLVMKLSALWVLLYILYQNPGIWLRLLNIAGTIWILLHKTTASIQVRDLFKCRV